ncbi:MAG: cytochrome c [Pseudomonadota bacterium]
MSTHKPGNRSLANPRTLAALAVSGLLLGSAVMAAEGPGLGKPISEAQLQGWDLIVAPDGTGLPEGSGTAAQGQAVYEQKCAACHGMQGEGTPGVPALAGGSLTATPPVMTAGSYWPHASTIFDYVRRAMPPLAPKSLTDTEVYQVTAYVLHLHGIVERDFVLDSASLPQVKMPNAGNFIDRSQVQ